MEAKSRGKPNLGNFHLQISRRRGGRKSQAKNQCFKCGYSTSLRGDRPGKQGGALATNVGLAGIQNSAGVLGENQHEMR